MYTPKLLKLWTRPNNYMGPNYPNTYSSGFGQHRDSDCLARSNFRCTLKALESVSDRVSVISESHWAVGWVEWIAIPADDYAALKCADEMVVAADNYPLLNESDFSELEQEEANSVWADCYSPSERVAYIREHKGDFEFRSIADLLGCVRGQFFAGDAGSLLG